MLEEEVREVLRSKVRRAPALDEPPTPVLRRARGRRALNGAGVTLAVAAIAVGSLFGVRSLGTSDIEPAGLVPWVERTVDTTPPTTPCDVRQIALRAAESAPQLTLLFRPKDASVRCALPPFEVVVRDARGKTFRADVDTSGIGVSAVGFPYQTMLLGGWIPCAPSGPTSITLVFSDGARLATDGVEAPFAEVCDQGQAPTGLTMSGAGTAFDEPSFVPGLDRIRAVVDAPASVRPGSTLRYRVRVTNPRNEPVPLSVCPAFAQVLESEQGHIEAPLTYLNCEAIGNVLKPRQSVTFAMRFDIPEDLPTGRWSLRWLVSYPTTGPDDSEVIQVVAG